MRHAFQNTLLMVAGGTLLPLALLAQEPRSGGQEFDQALGRTRSQSSGRQDRNCQGAA